MAATICFFIGRAHSSNSTYFILQFLLSYFPARMLAAYNTSAYTVYALCRDEQTLTLRSVWVLPTYFVLEFNKHIKYCTSTPSVRYARNYMTSLLWLVTILLSLYSVCLYSIYTHMSFIHIQIHIKTRESFWILFNPRTYQYL